MIKFKVRTLTSNLPSPKQDSPMRRKQTLNQLLPTSFSKCPIARKRARKTNKTKKAETSAATNDEPTPKKGFGKTGIALQHHSHHLSKRSFMNGKEPMGRKMATRARPITMVTLKACQSRPQRP